MVEKNNQEYKKYFPEFILCLQYVFYTSLWFALKIT